MSGKELAARVDRVAADRISGASELLVEVLSILSIALGDGHPLHPVARALLRGQPSMAPVWNAVRAALLAGSAQAFDQYIRRSERAARVLVRQATAILAEPEPQPLTFVTISFSGTVLQTLRALAGRQSLHVSCSDGLPALEGRRMTEQLAVAGVSVMHYTDAALGHALTGADGLLVGADAISPDWFLNKSGTRMLVASAVQQGVPVYVLATRDKFVSRVIASRLEVRDEGPDQVWPAPPPGVIVRNPCFERTPIDSIGAVISDVGVLGAGLVADACPTDGDDVLIDLLQGPA